MYKVFHVSIYLLLSTYIHVWVSVPPYIHVHNLCNALRLHRTCLNQTPLSLSTCTQTSSGGAMLMLKLFSCSAVPPKTLRTVITVIAVIAVITVVANSI